MCLEPCLRGSDWWCRTVEKMDTDAPQETTGRTANADSDDTIEETEQWFVHQGVPHFIVDYTATEKVLPRTVPVLALSVLLSVFVVVNRAWPLWHNVVAVFVAFLVLVGSWAIANRVRGLPARRLPQTVGVVEVSVFLFAPALLALWARNFRAAGLTVLVHTLQLVVIYYSTSYGIVPMTAWNVRRVVTHLDLGFKLAGRTFPILLLAVTFLLFNSPSWKTITVTPLQRYVALLGLFVGVTLLFVYQSVVSEYQAVATFDSPAELRDLCRHSPVAEIPLPPENDFPLTPTLTRRERANLLLMVIYSVWGYLMVLMTFILVFFILFGLLAIPADVVTDLVGQPAVPIATVVLFDTPISLTRELVRIAVHVLCAQPDLIE